MKKVLVPIDFSNVTDLVLENAKLIAKASNAEMKIIHVVDSLPQEVKSRIQSACGVSTFGDMGTVFVGPLNYEVIREEFAVKLKGEHKKLLEYKKKIKEEGINVRAFLHEGKVSETILQEVKEYKPNVIVMGSHGHGYVLKALLGSVTMSVLKHVSCPVMIVPFRQSTTEN